MEHWADQGIVLSARPHGEGGAVVAVLTEHNGRHSGYVHGGMSSKKRALIQPGSMVRAEWQSRVADQLGSYTLEADKGLSAEILGHSLKLAALLSACALCEAALPEREGHPGLFHGFNALLNSFESELWGAAYVMWEIQFLRELGFRLELDKCAGGGDPQTLAYVSPKSGRAVSLAQAAPYKEKLLRLPHFLRPAPMREEIDFDDDVFDALKMTGYFLEHWAFAHHTKGVPEPRLQFQQRFEKSLTQK